MQLNIYKYLDYRQFLVDLFEELSETDAAMSFRKFARICLSSSPNYLQLVRDRKLNIQEESATALSQYISLRKKEDAYFKILIGFDHAKNNELKDEYFKKILSAREYRSIAPLSKEQYDFFSHWYIPVVRELMMLPGFNDNAEFIEKLIIPVVSIAKIKKAISLLVQLNLVKKNTTTGNWEQTDKIMSTTSEVLSLAITKYHKDVLLLAIEAVDRFEKSERDIRSVTLGLSQKGFDEVKERLESFWKELLDKGTSAEQVERVYQINMQLFPLSGQGNNNG